MLLSVVHLRLLGAHSRVELLLLHRLARLLRVERAGLALASRLLVRPSCAACWLVRCCERVLLLRLSLRRHLRRRHLEQRPRG